MKLKIFPILYFKPKGAYCILCKYLVIDNDKGNCKQVIDSQWIPLQKIMTHIEGCPSYIRPQWKKL